MCGEMWCRIWKKGFGKKDWNGTWNVKKTRGVVVAFASPQPPTSPVQRKRKKEARKVFMIMLFCKFDINKYLMF